MRSRRSWSIEAEIGDAAGTTWRYLDEHGETTLGRLRQGTKVSDQLLLMGIGWLEREEKLSFVKEGRIVVDPSGSGDRMDQRWPPARDTLGPLVHGGGLA